MDSPRNSSCSVGINPQYFDTERSCGHPRWEFRLAMAVRPRFRLITVLSRFDQQRRRPTLQPMASAEDQTKAQLRTLAKEFRSAGRSAV